MYRGVVGTRGENRRLAEAEETAVIVERVRPWKRVKVDIHQVQVQLWVPGERTDKQQRQVEDDENEQEDGQVRMSVDKQEAVEDGGASGNGNGKSVDENRADKDDGKSGGGKGLENETRSAGGGGDEGANHVGMQKNVEEKKEDESVEREAGVGENNHGRSEENRSGVES